MKVKELIELLKTCPPNEEIILSITSAKCRPPDDLSRDIYRPIRKVNTDEQCDTCGQIWNEIKCHSPISGEIVDYERNRQEGDIDVVTLWSTN